MPVSLTSFTVNAIDTPSKKYTVSFPLFFGGFGALYEHVNLPGVAQPTVGQIFSFKSASVKLNAVLPPIKSVQIAFDFGQTLANVRLGQMYVFDPVTNQLTVVEKPNIIQYNEGVGTICFPIIGNCNELQIVKVTDIGGVSTSGSCSINLNTFDIPPYGFGV